VDADIVPDADTAGGSEPHVVADVHIAPASAEPHGSATYRGTEAAGNMRQKYHLPLVAFGQDDVVPLSTQKATDPRPSQVVR